MAVPKMILHYDYFHIWFILELFNSDNANALRKTSLSSQMLMYWIVLLRNNQIMKIIIFIEFSN